MKEYNISFTIAMVNYALGFISALSDNISIKAEVLFFAVATIFTIFYGVEKLKEQIKQQQSK